MKNFMMDKKTSSNGNSNTRFLVVRKALYTFLGHKKSQSILDFVLGFIAIAFFTVGIVQLWTWFDANYAKRQIEYQKGRTYSGKALIYDSHPRPIAISGTETDPDRAYQPIDLTEEWVFKGQLPESVSSLVTGVDDASAVLTPAQCQTEALGQPGCGNTLDEFNSECAYYTHCTCLFRVSLSAQIWRDQAVQLRSQLADLRKAAHDLDEAADSCEWWMVWCWFGNYRSTARKLRRTARKLRKAANKMEAQAAELEQKANDLEACCEKPTLELQTICMKVLKGADCSDIVDDLESDSGSQIEQLKIRRAELQAAVDSIGNGSTFGTIFDCNNQASNRSYNECLSACTVCYTVDYCEVVWSCVSWCIPPLYEQYRNQCCQLATYQALPWGGRNCDYPVPPCEDETQANKCSLASGRDKLIADIAEIDAEIAQTSRNSADMPACCDLETRSEQMECLYGVSGRADTAGLTNRANQLGLPDCDGIADPVARAQCFSDQVPID